MTQHFTINPTQRLTPTGRRAITRSKIEGPNQDKSTVPCVNRQVLHTLKPEQYYPGYSRGRLSVVKTSIAGASGRGFQRICIRELDGPRQHDLLIGIDLHLRIMDL